MAHCSATIQHIKWEIKPNQNTTPTKSQTIARNDSIKWHLVLRRRRKENTAVGPKAITHWQGLCLQNSRFLPVTKCVLMALNKSDRQRPLRQKKKGTAQSCQSCAIQIKRVKCVGFCKTFEITEKNVLDKFQYKSFVHIFIEWTPESKHGSNNLNSRKNEITRKKRTKITRKEA